MASQSAALTVLLWVGVFHSEIIRAPEHTYRSIELAATPVPVNHAPQPLASLPAQIPVVVAHLDSPETLHLPPSQSKPRTEIDPEPAPEVAVAPRKLEPLPPSNVVIPKPGVKTNLFSTGSSAPATIAKAPDRVQTGGFGDPNGLPAKASEGKAVNIAQLGSYDLPTGAGSGNGSGGGVGVRGVVASTGFGSGVSTGDNGGVPSSRGSVRQGGFGDAQSPAPVTHSQSKELSGRIVPAEILSKPVPVYTQEARGLRIEGEVLLEVVLQASGTLQVVRVVRGLGHGLDDAAVHAAEQIRFKPALRDGQPADSTAVLHIIFQLA
ncbi:MAG TPA: energy transducer TonB [Candidatus Sulfotelmatobacter sp.]